jgi:hypothetical protein
VNYTRIVLAFLGAAVVYFVCGFIMLAALPAMKAEFLKYPNVYRSQEDMMKVMPYNMVAILVSIVVVAVFYAQMYPSGGGIASGAYFGALVGIFAVCAYCIHNYALQKIGLALMLWEASPTSSRLLSVQLSVSSIDLPKRQ